MNESAISIRDLGRGVGGVGGGGGGGGIGEKEKGKRE